MYTADELLPRLCGTTPGGHAPLPTVLLGGMDAVLFVEEALPRLLDHPDVAVHERGERPDFRAAENEPVVELTASESTDPDWFDLGVKVSVDGEQIPFEDLIRALAQDATHMVAQRHLVALDRPELRPAAPADRGGAGAAGQAGRTAAAQPLPGRPLGRARRAGRRGRAEPRAGPRR